MEHLNPFEMIRILLIDAGLPLHGTMYSFDVNRYLRRNFYVQNVCSCVWECGASTKAANTYAHTLIY